MIPHQRDERVIEPRPVADAPVRGPDHRLPVQAQVRRPLGAGLDLPPQGIMPAAVRAPDPDGTISRLKVVVADPAGAAQAIVEEGPFGEAGGVVELGFLRPVAVIVIGVAQRIGARLHHLDEPVVPGRHGEGPGRREALPPPGHVARGVVAQRIRLVAVIAVLGHQPAEPVIPAPLGLEPQFTARVAGLEQQGLAREFPIQHPARRIHAVHRLAHRQQRFAGPVRIGSAGDIHAAEQPGGVARAALPSFPTGRNPIAAIARPRVSPSPTALPRSLMPTASDAAFAAAATLRTAPPSAPPLDAPQLAAAWNMQSGQGVQNPNGSEKFTGSPCPNPYAFNPPASPIGSSCVNRPVAGS